MAAMLAEEPHPVDLAIDLALDVARVWEATARVVELAGGGNFHLDAIGDVYEDPVSPDVEAAVYLLARVYYHTGTSAARMRDTIPAIMSAIITDSVGLA